MEKTLQTRFHRKGIRIDSDNHTADVTHTNFAEWLNAQSLEPTASVVHRFTRGLCGSQQTEPPHINTNPHFNILTASHNRHRLMQYKRIQCHMCSTKNKQKQNSSVKNATKGCMPPHVSKYITPNCIFEDLLTLKWNGGTHKCQ